MSADQIVTLVSARSLLAVFLAIHVGVLMGRLGTRRVFHGSFHSPAIASSGVIA
jgi:hypothetical protein